MTIEIKPPFRLYDSQWVNVVNHPGVISPDEEINDRIHLAVKMTEQKMAENFSAQLQECLAREREACAKVCEAKGDAIITQNRMVSAYVLTGECALAIRERSNAK